MKVNLIFLLLFITICFSSISQTQKPDSIVVTMDKQTKRNIDKYNNFWYLFPYVTVYDSRHPNGIEILNKQSLKDTITTLLFSTEDDFYILNCRTLQSEVEVVVKNGDKVILSLNNEQIAIKVTNRTTQPLEFKVDDILYHRQKNPLILVKKYYNPLHFMSIEEALKTPKKKNLVKKQAFEEIAACIKSATQIVDSLEQNALISTNTASFNKTKFRTFLLSLNILESKINFDSARILLNSYPNTLLYPDKYHYKLAECITDKFIVEKAKEIQASNPDKYLILGQFENPANPQIHFDTTGPEIFNDLDGKVDIFVAGVGTGGTITGVSRYLKNEKKLPLLTVAVEPAESPVITQAKAGEELKPGPHKIQGIGAGFIPGNLDLAQVDEVERVTSDEAIAGALRLMREEGILAGISSGAALVAAQRLAAKPENAGKNIVVILASAAERYLTSPLFASVFTEQELQA